MGGLRVVAGLVCRVAEDEVRVASCRYHYGR